MIFKLKFEDKDQVKPKFEHSGQAK
jgi:hypothetical protein